MLILARLISASCRSLAAMLGLGGSRSGRRAASSGSPDDFAATRAFRLVPLSSAVPLNRLRFHPI
jgi:hypothetical protein